ncbi:3'-5' exonuclease [Limnohabitans sp. T6-5]|uniref:3'-5' exonuclease n=1 Tax=Limnohabitans sp. T6-5 TaxID=1100724 RepID=UPI0018EE4A98|nr:3'-5' exonuclease [Limnohabitans sp. T6-5]
MFKTLRDLWRRLTTKSTAIPMNSTIGPTLANNLPLVSSHIDNSASLIFMDTETTGLNQNGTDEVLEIAIVSDDGRTLLNTLVRPLKNSVWSQAQAIHGISPKDVENAPTWDSLLPKVAEICAGKTIVVYNAPFDTSFFPGGFFTSVVCAMRRYTEVCPDGTMWTKLSDAATASGYAPTGNYHRALSDALACRHIWKFGIPALEKNYPPIINSRIAAKIIAETGEHIPLVFNNVFAEQLRFVTANDRCKFWTKDDRQEINIYRPGTLGGKGKIAYLTKAENPELARQLAAGFEIDLLLRERDGDTLRFEVVTKPNRKTPTVMTLPATTKTYSEIDNDIYQCFIAHRSGMSNVIGSWEDFQTVENEMALICKEKGGRYYKSKAKGAKFAIIFSPYAQTANDVLRLQQEGYKVTSFDRAVAFFQLQSMWDCQQYVDHVKSLNSNINTFG